MDPLNATVGPVYHWFSDGLGITLDAPGVRPLEGSIHGTSGRDLALVRAGTRVQHIWRRQ